MSYADRPGVGLRGGVKLHGLLGLVSGHGERKIRELVCRAEAYAAEHRVDAAFRSWRTQAGWHLSFHPAACEILVEVRGGYIVLSAETGNVGPGYHAFIVGFIDYLGQDPQWAWVFADAPLGFADDTGYYETRDFAALQAAMAGDFTELSRMLVDARADEARAFKLGLTFEHNIAGDDFAATSLGFRDRAFFENPVPEAFFPWWEAGVTAATARRMALCKMWLDVVWQPPGDAVARRDLENTRRLVDYALGLGATFADNEGVSDIDALLRDETLDDDDAVGKIGYWRQDAWYMEPGGWMIRLPAFYQQETTADGQGCSLSHGNRYVYMSSDIHETERSGLAWPEPIAGSYGEHTRFKTEGYWALILAGETDETGIRWWIWQGMCESLDGHALVTVMSTHADDAAWAEKVIRSVQDPSADIMVASDASL